MDDCSKKILVFDIGGTHLRGALFCPHQHTLSQRIVKQTPNRQTCPQLTVEQIYQTLLQFIESMSRELLAREPACAISIAFPGPIDRAGQIVSAPGIWGANPSGPIDILNDLRRLWPRLPIHLCNDLTAAGYRYLDRYDETFCLVTVSTGIGNKIFINGKPQLGPTGTGGEIGHAKVLFSDTAPLCDCGETGHLQALSSGRGVLMAVQQQAQLNPYNYAASLLYQKHPRPQEISNHAIVKAFHASDPFTVPIVHESIRPLAAMLNSLHLALGLERFILIGGFALALGEAYRQALVTLAQEQCWQKQTDWDRMVQFGFDDDLSGLIGAGKYAVGNS